MTKDDRAKIAKAYSDYAIAAGQCANVLYNLSQNQNGPAGPELLPPHLKLWICSDCLTPRLYGSKPKCYACGSGIFRVGEYHIDAATPTPTDVEAAMTEYADQLDLLAADNEQTPRSLDEHAKVRAELNRTIANGIRVRLTAVRAAKEEKNGS